MTLIQALFSHARIVIDRLHLVQLLTRAMGKTRIEVMKRFSTQSIAYKRWKRYRKLIQFSMSKLDARDFKH